MITTTTVHDLKAWPEYYWPVARGEKPFEIRKNDRNFQVGQFLRLHEYDPESQSYSGNSSELFEITYLTDFAQQPGYVVLGIRPALNDAPPQSLAGLLSQVGGAIGSVEISEVQP